MVKPAETDYKIIVSDYKQKDSLHDKKMNMVLSKVSACEYALDVGCGTGELIARLKNTGKCQHIFGIDTSDVAIEICSERFRNEKNIDISKISMMKLAEKYSGLFDYIFFLDVIEHNDFIDIIDIFNNAKMLLKPDGKIIVTTPGVLDIFTIYRHRFRSIPYKHVTGHSSYGWASVVRKARFKVLEHRTVEFPLVDSDFLNIHAHVFGKCHMIIAQMGQH